MTHAFPTRRSSELAGLAEGVDRYESSLGGTGGCPFVPKATGNICTEDLLYLLAEMGIETGIDIRRMVDLACDMQSVLGRELPGQIMKAGLRLDLHPMESVRTAVGWAGDAFHGCTHRSSGRRPHAASRGALLHATPRRHGGGGHTADRKSVLVGKEEGDR